MQIGDATKMVFKMRKMIRVIILLTATLFISSTAKGQNLFFFGDKSYQCTETITLQSNNDGANPSILFAKEGTNVLMAISIYIGRDYFIGGNLIIYLDDGTVISCEDKGKYDSVDNISTTLYSLTDEQLSQMKTSNINTIRYRFKPRMATLDAGGSNYSASNKEVTTNKGRSTKTDVPALLKEFFGN